jgi:hypothetical protein
MTYSLRAPLMKSGAICLPWQQDGQRINFSKKIKKDLTPFKKSL